MDRRTFIVTGLGACAAFSARAAAAPDALDALLAQLDEDPTLVEDSWLLRESNQTRGVGKGKKSSRPVARRATDMIIRFEVASPRVYQRKWERPIWPGGQSGVTIGVGYDLRFANEEFLNRDWPMLSTSDRQLLRPALGVQGLNAKRMLPAVHSVLVPWPAADTQFRQFLPYPTAQTETAFPNCSKLNDESFGALVSLIYNRGPAIPRNSTKRREMREIRELMAEEKFSAIPERIRAMKRLWPGPKERGLRIRRDAEALLFEMGLHQSGQG